MEETRGSNNGEQDQAGNQFAVRFLFQNGKLMRRTLSVYRVVGVICLGLLAGCGGSTAGPRRLNVSGKVEFNGAPVPYGEIVFLPDESRGATGASGFATITDGQYRTETGTGPSAGQLIAIVTGYKTGEVTGPEGRPPLFLEHRIPVELADDKTVVDLQVPGSAGIE